MPATTSLTVTLLACGVAAAMPCRAAEPCADIVVEQASPDPQDADVARLYAVKVIAPDDIWAVGFYRTCTDCAPAENTQQYSLTMHFDGESWSIVDAPSPLNPVGDANISLLGVDALSSDQVYAAGHATINQSLSPDTFALRWDGGSWEQIETPGQSGFGASGFLFEDVDAINPENIWFGGQFADPPGDPHGVMVHYDGSNTTTYILPIMPNVIAAHRIRAIDSLGPDDVWAVGSAGGGGVAVGVSYVMRWDGSSWSHVPTPHPGFGEILRDVVAIAPDDVWVSGRYQVVSPDGTSVLTLPLFLHWDGSGWTQHESPAFANAMVAIAPDDIYGVEGNTLVHWDGSSWSLLDTLTPEPGSPGFINLLGLDAVTDCELVGVGMTFFSATDNTTLITRIVGDETSADLNRDGVIDSTDLNMVLGDFGCQGGPCPGDVDGDGDTDSADLNAVLGAFGDAV